MTPLSTLMHDTAHNLSVIDNEVTIIKRKKIEGVLSDLELIDRLNSIKMSAKSLAKRQDEFYKQYNDKFK